MADGIFVLVAILFLCLDMTSNIHHKSSDILEKSFFDTDSSDTIKSTSFLKELKKNKESLDNTSITVDDSSQIELILKSYADSDKRKVLETTAGKSKSIMEILKICTSPQTSAYRKIKSLIESGLLISDGFIFKHGKKIVKYKSVFEDITINILQNKITITVKLAAKK